MSSVRRLLTGQYALGPSGADFAALGIGGRWAQLCALAGGSGCSEGMGWAVHSKSPALVGRRPVGVIRGDVFEEGPHPGGKAGAGPLAAALPGGSWRCGRPGGQEVVWR